uniref:Uncharacterized protein n=1 Tax=Chromera velia CCMP2878 TaxID=1169474 RepID=A0A0G4HRE8_9ALVE|mmetsp:Transcript_41820/g.82585  ORF Transcript_41820/g.82585 Transcript_41820/m.82585 type:complete len:245 (-) Transcript_41820:647-1381(-)|eukprot:Cvel_8106.t1-p1 / transcript=Cvel_8106.t1 / gene=Cvel_8106 / organism=Chromera_velia_CCMP2878 / gene_product=hypothetical protein / transcript_product=hypothetical protein / location=Cvel_scaffold441:2682-3413(+) / protein_length=244 / sequence_SO=supercontig / SO=protein_coding / is_pseudo=false
MAHQYEDDIERQNTAHDEEVARNAQQEEYSRAGMYASSQPAQQPYTDYNAQGGVATGQPVPGQPQVYGQKAAPQVVVTGVPEAYPQHPQRVVAVIAEIEVPPDVNVQKCAVAYQLSGGVQCLAIVDLVFGFFWFLYPGLWFLFFLSFLSLLGFFGARLYNNPLIWGYIGYLTIMLGFKIYLFVLSVSFGFILSAILWMLNAVVQMWVIWVVVRFTRAVSALNGSELRFLKEGGRPGKVSRFILY